MSSNRYSALYKHAIIPLGYYLIRAYLCGIRIEVLNEEFFTRHVEKGGKAIAAIWHQRFFGVIGYAKKFNKLSASAIISKSGDGELISQVAIRLGIRPIRGSSSSGGKEALEAIVNDLAVHRFAIQAVDGPKGPRQVVKAGLIRMAQLSGAPIFPVCIALNRAWMLNSWDRFLIPKPFSKVLVHWGNPIFIPAEIDTETFENLRLQVEERMIKGHFEYDRTILRNN
jgi:lysophospholipid acyltransferase (LPLAT)-like uncharacterized protein